MVNKATLVGRLGKDPETRYTQSGKNVCNFSIATDEQWKNETGEKQQKTSWHRLVVWGKLGEICQQYLKKGGLVYVEGPIQYREWEDKDGNKRNTTEINVREMRMLGNKPREEAPVSDEDAPRGYSGPGENATQSINETVSTAITDEDIPF